MSNSKVMNNFLGWSYKNLPRFYKKYGHNNYINIPYSDISTLRSEWISQMYYSLNKEDYIFSERLFKKLFCDNMKVDKIYDLLSTYTFAYEKRYLI